MATPSTQTIGDIVAADYRTAAIFEKHGIDFCCGGKVSLVDTCQQKQLDMTALLAEIESVKNTPVERSQNYAAWSLSFLADYIINTHHSYLNDNLEAINGYCQKIARVHAARHPELVEIAAIFATIADDLITHLRTEEDVCFPAIKRIEAAQKAGSVAAADDIATLRESLATLQLEHDAIGDATHRIRHLALDYAIPADACNTYKLAFQKLNEFEDDLHKHVHLENNILFLRATALLEA